MDWAERRTLNQTPKVSTYFALDRTTEYILGHAAMRVCDLMGPFCMAPPSYGKAETGAIIKCPHHWKVMGAFVPGRDR
jgi:hypothetical protein